MPSIDDHIFDYFETTLYHSRRLKHGDGFGRKA